MRSIRTRLERLVPAALVAVPLGCSGPLPGPIAAAHPDDPAPRRGGTLHLATFSDIRGSLDPATTPEAVSLSAIHLMFAGLVDYDAHARVVPDLAERWEVDDGGRTYRFFLRPGVRMHDGEELTADDVKRSAERALHPSTPNGNASYFGSIAGYEAYSKGKAPHLDGVVVEGRYVVAFHLAEPDGTFLYALALHTLRPTCRSAGDLYSDTWSPCGAGPFRLEAGGWQRGTSLRLVRHEGYFRPGLPHLDAVEWTFNMPFVSQRLRFERGELDIARELTQADSSRYVADPRWRSLGVVEPDTKVYGESMNTRLPPFDNVEIRRAVAAAIDRDHYRLLQPTRISVLTQLHPGAVADRDPSFVGQRYDYAAALEHMRKAGYPYDPATGEGGWPQPVEYLMYDQGIVAFTAQLLQQDLARIGIRLRLKMVSWPAFLALQERAGASQMSQGNWEMDFPDPSSLFEPLFTTAYISPEQSFNTAFYSNARFDDLVSRAHHETDGAQRAALYHEANVLLCDDAPWAFTFAYHFFDLPQPYVRGFSPHPVWPLDASGVWIDRDDEQLGKVLGGGLR